MKTCPILKAADMIRNAGKHKNECLVKECGMYQHCFNITSSYRDASPGTHIYSALEDPPDEEEFKSWTK